MVFSFKAAILEFANRTESLESTLPGLLHAIHRVQAETSKQHADFSKAHAVPVPGNPTSYSINIDAISAYTRLRRRLNHNQTAITLLPGTFLIALVSQYDAYLGHLIRGIFLNKTSVLNASDKTIPYSQIVTFNTIDDAKNYVINKEVDGVLRESHVAHFDWLEKRLGITLRKGLAIWPAFVELTERRNLLSHCDGIVSAQYLQICREQGASIPSETVVGTKLDTDLKYCRSAFRSVFEIGVKLGHVIWRKIRPDQAGEADGALNEICIELITTKSYDLAIALLEFSCTSLKPFIASLEMESFFRINLAQAYKWSGNNPKCLELLGEIDWSDKSDKICLGVAVLRDRFDEAAALVKKIHASDPVVSFGYMNWPIFEEFRKTTLFHEAYLEVFKKPFVIIEDQTPSVATQAKPMVARQKPPEVNY